MDAGWISRYVATYLHTQRLMPSKKYAVWLDSYQIAHLATCSRLAHIFVEHALLYQPAQYTQWLLSELSPDVENP
jgi:hypothetical protein